MTNLLITGGAGFIGANFVHHWRTAHPADEVVVLDLLTYAGNRASIDHVAGVDLVVGVSARPIPLPFVVERAVAGITEADVRAFCEVNLTGYKQPKVVEFRTELPKTPVGKILRRELRDKK